MKNIIDSLKWRYAVKKFDSTKKVSDENLAKIKEALILSPSSFGLQAWKFLIITDPEIREKLRKHSWGQPQITDCSHLIVLCNLEKIDEIFIDKFIQLNAKKGSRSDRSLEGFKQMIMDNVVEPNSRSGKNQKSYMQNQVFIALGNLMTVCAALEIDTCPIGGFDSEKYDEILGLKEKGIQSCVVCPIGYRSEEDAHRNDPKIRFDESDLIEDI